MKQFLFPAIIAILLTSCSKEKSIEATINANGSETKDTWQPMSKNSYWKYKTTGDMEYETTTTSTGQKRTVNGIDYIVFKTVTTGTPEGEALFAIKDHNYYSLAAGISPNTGASFNVNYLYMNDTASVGYTWEHTAGQGNGFVALTPGRIVEKGISLTVEGKTYTDVIHSQIDLQYEIPLLGALTFATYDYYAAKTVGIIRIETHGDPLLANGIEAVTDLVEYSIK